MAIDPNIELWAMDEVMFQQHGSTCKMWIAPEEHDPVVFHHPTRKSIGYHGAVRLNDGKFVYLRETNKFDTNSSFTFLKLLRKITAPSKRKVVVIIDNARYHHAKAHKQWRDDCSEKFALLFLPPYSPELNPSERIWKLTRRTSTHNRYFSSLDEVIIAVEIQFEQWTKGNDTLRRLCAIN